MHFASGIEKMKMVFGFFSLLFASFRFQFFASKKAIKEVLILSLCCAALNFLYSYSPDLFLSKNRSSFRFLINVLT
jgi:hypothetical protein